MTDLNTADEPVAEIERHASWAELFFDLVVVAGVATLAHVLASEVDASALGLYAVLFLAFWLSWTTFMLYGNIAAAQTHIIRLLVGMFGLGVMAASVPGVAHAVLEDGESIRALNVFAIAYIATRVYGSQSWRRGEVLLDFPVVQHSVGLLPWIVSIWLEEPWKLALWAVGVGLDLMLILVVSGDEMLQQMQARVTAGASRRRPRRNQRGDAKITITFRNGEAPAIRNDGETPFTRRTGSEGPAIRSGSERPGRRRNSEEPVIRGVSVDAAHLAERLGLFVIIVLGESVVQVVEAASEVEYGRGLLGSGIVSFVLLAGMFGLSVVYGYAGLPHLRAGGLPARAALGLHCLATAVIVTIAVSLASVIEHGEEPLPDQGRWLLCGAVAAYFALGLVASIASHGLHLATAAAWIATGIAVPILLALFATEVGGRGLVAYAALLILAHLWFERGIAAQTQQSE